MKSSPYSNSKSSEELEGLGGIWVESEVLWRGRCRDVGGSGGAFSRRGSKMISSGVSVPPKAIKSSSGESPYKRKKMYITV